MSENKNQFYVYNLNQSLKTYILTITDDIFGLQKYQDICK